MTDKTGAVLPGVTVEATSPVLIEKVRTVVTNGQGRYTIVDLRPGTYRMSFGLPGFNMVVREGVELPGDFTLTVNVQLSVGALEETVTVSGAAPVVDVQSAARTQVINRDLLDALPTPRNTQSFGYLAQGVRLSKPDVGGRADDGAGQHARARSEPAAHDETQTRWDVPISVFPNRQRTVPVQVRLTPPGTKFLARWNQVDVAFRKNFRFGGYQFTAQADVYNALNSAVVTAQTDVFGPNLDFPNTILQGRLLRAWWPRRW